MTQKLRGPMSIPPTISRSSGAKVRSPTITMSKSRCTLRSFWVIRMMPTEKSAGKTSAIAPSFLTKGLFWMISTRITIKMPVKAAPRIKKGEFSRSEAWASASCPISMLARMIKATTMPGSREWLIASVTKAFLRRIRITPGRAHATAAIEATMMISI